MGSSVSTKQITQEKLEEYCQLTFLTKAEIMHIYKLFKTLGPEELNEDFKHRFPVEHIVKIFPAIRHNPFRDSIMRVFSSEQDGHFSFEDTLDLCSALSENCPEEVRAAWAFRIFDFDGDNQLSLDDLIESIERLTGLNENSEPRIDRPSSEYIAQAVLQEMDMDHTGSIAPQEFVHIVSRMPEFTLTFRFMP
ncbi:calcium and integrin-binding protein 1 [Neodiprion pinetum]|uniref:Calcium and integrin-binding protein 1 n=1 Tax=Neodiprion lecontei TaxID=441921 RepID=A0A6J0BVR2_NEOLC|nr:calcium and integrin-binding protein 1 [Neodiprion lecontei]XP_046410634.1 calcium and integrin-binding protein 1-like [Neodiprion fabricii]XP_046469634.1 calcium and integrin-binding protein 1-like [Neodiprion pinetum]XP_046603067.1 calcium and integrin-binding protein 1-like [Neodiprion virginianus]